MQEKNREFFQRNNFTATRPGEFVPNLEELPCYYMTQNIE